MPFSGDAKTPKTVVYTVIMGGYDVLLPTPGMPNIDFVAFCDVPLHSSYWDVQIIRPEFPEDLARSSRLHKILPHRFLPDYDISIYIDGNILVKGELQSLMEKGLKDHSMAAFDHSYTQDPKSCIYQEFEAVKSFATDRQKNLDDPVILEKHFQFLLSEKYPKEHGLNNGGVLLRRHHDPQVVKAMELWWDMVVHYSRRDQLSLNYALWKTGLEICSLPYDVRRQNPWFYHVGGHGENVAFRLLKYRLKRWLGRV